MQNNDKWILKGGGFHCEVILDLKEVKSIQRCSFWGRGWWYSCTTLDDGQIDIHINEKIDVLALFEELQNEKRKSR